MGSELTCLARYQNREGHGKALLETDEIIFRSDDLRFTIPLKTITATEVRKGHLILTTADGVAVLDLGPQADVWARKITSPKPLTAKLDVRKGLRTRLSGTPPEGFSDTWAKAGAKIVDAAEPADAIFLFVNSRSELDSVATLAPSLTPGGALWIVRPRGDEDFKEKDVLDAGRAAGLVDVKVVRFSDVLTAHKFVIRKSDPPGSA
jgi:hypothetical protein